MRISSRRRAQAYPLHGDLTLSVAGERYSQIADRILARMPNSGNILITSAGAGDGKTVTATNLALALHARRIPVLLVELSLVKPRFVEIFGEPPLQKGIEDVLGGKADLQSVVCMRGDNNLSLAVVRKAQSNSGLLDPSPQLNQLLSDAKKAFRLTILDGPALDDCPHMMALVENIELSIMVARARHTNIELFRTNYSSISRHRPMVLFNDER